MKGFIKIFESIIASIIILASLTFFFSIDIKPTNWDDALLQIRAEDILYTIASNGTLVNSVSSNDQSLINNSILSSSIEMLPPTMDYSLEIRGIPNPVIYVGCNCSALQITDLQNTLIPLDFNYKERDISIRIEDASLDNIRDETNILFLPGYKNLTQYKTKIDDFLSNGGTIFMVSDLTQTNVNDRILNETFGLNWNSGGTFSNTGSFYGPDNENITTFKIRKYFANLTGDADSFDFMNFQAKITEDNRTIVKSSTDLSLVKINEDVVNGNGRTVWMLNHTLTSADSNLTKSMILWASGERFLMNKVKVVPPKRIEARYIADGSDPFEAVLTIWRVFQ